MVRLQQSSSSMKMMSALCMTNSESSTSALLRRSLSTKPRKNPSTRTISLAAGVCLITAIKTDFYYSMAWSFFLTAFIATQQEEAQKMITSRSWTSTRKITTKSMAQQPWWTLENSPGHLRDFSSAIGRSTETTSLQFSLETTNLQKKWLNQLLVGLNSLRTNFQEVSKQPNNQTRSKQSIKFKATKK